MTISIFIAVAYYDLVLYCIYILRFSFPLMRKKSVLLFVYSEESDLYVKTLDVGYQGTVSAKKIANTTLRLEWAQRWRNLTVAHWQHVIFGDESRFQLYPVDGRLRVRRVPGERFRPGCQAHRVQAGGGSVHVWGAFHNSAKSPLVLPDGYLTAVFYRGILQNTLVPFARHYFGDNYRYQDDNATPHRARVVFDFLQQGNVTKMEQPPRSPDCNPIEHLWDELGRAISSMDNPPHLYFENDYINYYIMIWYNTDVFCFNTLRPRQNGRHFPDDIFKRIFLMSFARPCLINGRRSLYNAFSAL